MNYDGRIIEVPGWAKFNPRGKEKKEHHHHWFRLEDNLLSDPQFADFTAQDICVLVYVLATTCQKQGQLWKLNSAFAAKHARVKINEVSSAISKLLELNVVRLSEGCRTNDREVSSTHNITVHNITDITEQKTNAQSPASRSLERVSFDFLPLYKKFPRKVGKQKGLEKARASVKTPSDFDALSTAIDRYRDYCVKGGIEPQYVQHFSTFMTAWRDWLEPDAGTNALAAKKSVLEILKGME